MIASGVTVILPFPAGSEVADLRDKVRRIRKIRHVRAATCGGGVAAGQGFACLLFAKTANFSGLASVWCFAFHSS